MPPERSEMAQKKTVPIPTSSYKSNYLVFSKERSLHTLCPSIFLPSLDFSDVLPFFLGVYITSLISPLPQYVPTYLNTLFSF